MATGRVTVSASDRGAKLLVSTAVRQRRRRRSGWSLAWALFLAVVLFGIGVTPFFTAGYSLARLIVSLVFFVLALIPAIRGWRRLHPSRPWGTAAIGPCPKCGRPGLREKEMFFGSRGYKTITTYRGIVALCTDECGFTHVRPPSIWAAGTILGGRGAAGG
jgi:hypothetical protein